MANSNVFDIVKIQSNWAIRRQGGYYNPQASETIMETSNNLDDGIVQPATG